MYSRRTGILQTSSEGLKKIENFNKNLREQYNAKTNTPTVVNKANRQGNDLLTSIGTLLGNEEVILIGLILLLLFDINRDYLLIGILAILLLLN